MACASFVFSCIRLSAHDARNHILFNSLPRVSDVFFQHSSCRSPNSQEAANIGVAALPNPPLRARNRIHVGAVREPPPTTRPRTRSRKTVRLLQ